MTVKKLNAASALIFLIFILVGCTSQPPPTTTTIQTSQPPPQTTTLPPTTPVPTVIDKDRDGISDQTEQELAVKFAPIVMLHPTDPYRPSNILWYLERVRLRYDVSFGLDDQLLGKGQVNITSLLSQSDRGESSGLSADSTNFFLEQTDVIGGDNLDAYRTQTRAGTAASDWICYIHVRPAPGVGGMIDLQYIFFYPYNGDLLPGDQLESAHEADFEHITVRVNGDGVTIYKIFYSAHGNDGKWYDQASAVGAPDGYSLSDGRPVVYSAVDSHASYPWEGTWVRNNLPDDYTSSGGPSWDTVASVSNVGEKAYPAAGAEWIQYSGHWGEIGSVIFTTGPYGPAYQGWWGED